MTFAPPEPHNSPQRTNMLEDQLEAAAARIAELEGELNRRKGDAVTRLHNLCEGIERESDASAFSREEWERVDKETVANHARIASLEAENERLRMCLDWLHTYMSIMQNTGSISFGDLQCGRDRIRAALNPDRRQGE